MKYYISEINKDGTIAVDDTILVKGVLCSAGSHIMDGFEPLFSAEAVERLEKAGYKLSGKTNVGEFGLDLMGEFSYYGAVSEGGKLAGAAAALVKKGEAKAALNVDLNGSPRRAAALGGVDFIKPTYGTVSRYGVIPAACSGEQIGVTAASAEAAAEVLGVIAGHDDKDGTSLPQASYEYKTDEGVKGKKIAVISELFDAASDEVKKTVEAYAEGLKAEGAEVKTISLEEAKAAQLAWTVLSAAESCNNFSRYDGVKFGYRTPDYKNIDDLYVNTRTEGLNFLTKATVLYGSNVLSKGRYFDCYDKALRIRRLVSEKMAEIFKEFDAVLVPACGEASYEEYDIKEAFEKTYKEALFTAIPSITGIPAMATGGVQLMAAAFGESTLLSVAAAMERRG